MKLTFNQKTFSQYLSLVERAVPSRSIHPILNMVLIKASQKANQVSLTGIDLSLGIKITFNAQVSEDGAIALPAKLLNDIVSRLENSEFNLNLNKDSKTVTLTSKTGKYQLRGMDTREFPELPDFNSASIVEIPVSNLLEGIQGCLFAASKDQCRQIITGIHLALEKDGLEFASTDGHRLSVVRTNIPDTNSSVEVTIPTKSLQELKKMVANTCEPDKGANAVDDSGSRKQLACVNLRLGDSEVNFEWENQEGDNFQLITRTLHGQYPTYHQLIPKSFQRKISLDKKELLSVLERLQVFSTHKHKLVKLDIDSKKQLIDISSEEQDIGMATESMSASISGDDIKIAFNITYLMEGLKALPGNETLIQMNTELTPVTFNCLGVGDMTYLAMPVELR